jgi:transglutaminase-like putative cysteine protease
VDEYLGATWFLDRDSPAVVELARATTRGASSDLDRAVRLYYAIRDDIRYDPYAASDDPGAYRASTVAGAPSAFCIQKAILMAASGRALGIPTRLGYADVRNHLTSAKLRATMGSDLFVWHGFTELWLDGKWVKATPVFNSSLCERFGVLPLDFDGTSDAILHPFDAAGRRHMEYVREHGSFADFPYDRLMAAFRETYPGFFDKTRAAREPDQAFDPERPPG